MKGEEGIHLWGEFSERRRVRRREDRGERKRERRYNGIRKPQRVACNESLWKERGADNKAGRRREEGVRE